MVYLRGPSWTSAVPKLFSEALYSPLIPTWTGYVIIRSGFQLYRIFKGYDISHYKHYHRSLCLLMMHYIHVSDIHKLFHYPNKMLQKQRKANFSLSGSYAGYQGASYFLPWTASSWQFVTPLCAWDKIDWLIIFVKYSGLSFMDRAYGLRKLLENSSNCNDVVLQRSWESTRAIDWI